MVSIWKLFIRKLYHILSLSNNVLLDTIVDSFHNGDEFKPMRHMLALLSNWKEGATLVKESLRTKIRESSDLLIPYRWSGEGFVKGCQRFRLTEGLNNAIFNNTMTYG